ncbi:hypothetical protein CPB83DRAFT_850587 [Crepidotus variabilis]|uniref:Uncharacterized protein n=1 Tax=Crepidotus variabilis TaxID=179855 RepID=A0A9P6EKM4_9AGAR|nr:hypothetical protein CPB83DRAFT_850587 [Crepidotus variabilis]
MASSSSSSSGSAPPSAFSNYYRPRPLNRRTASSYETRHDVRQILTKSQHHHRFGSAGSSSSTPLAFNSPNSTSSTSASAVPATSARRPTPISRATTPNPSVQPLTIQTSSAINHDQRFSRLFPTSLGSPFLTTSEPPQLDMESLDLSAQPQQPLHNYNHGQYHGSGPPSPTPTADFSIIDADTDDSDTNPLVPGSFPTRSSLKQPRLISSLRGRQLSYGQGNGAMPWGSSHSANNNHRESPASPMQTSSSLKSLLPRLWDALSSPGRTILSTNSNGNTSMTNSTSTTSSPSSSRTASPSNSPRQPPAQASYNHTQNASLNSNGRHSPAYWAAGSLSRAKGKSKASGGLFSTRCGNTSRNELAYLSDNINYSELPPLDGEEGELIDDEACFIETQTPYGIDILSQLPLEISLLILTHLSSPHHPPYSHSSSKNYYLNTPTSPGRTSVIISEAESDYHEAVKAVLACRLVCRKWCGIASDNAIWMSLFLSRWSIDLRKAADGGVRAEDFQRSVRTVLGRTWEVDVTVGVGEKAKRLLGLDQEQTRPPASDVAPYYAAPLRLDWRLMFRERLELEKRWNNIPVKSEEAWMCSSGGTGPQLSESKISGQEVALKPFQPKPMQLTGHSDSVYCLELDSRRIITGSRDKSIKVWSLRTGRLLATFRGAHSGSILSLQFQKDWDRGWDEQDEEEEGNTVTTDVSGANGGIPTGGGTVERRINTPPGKRTGFMVSGSSDCSICVWDLHLGPLLEPDEDTPPGGPLALSSASDVGYSSNSVRRTVERDEGERTVTAEVRAILKGHGGGVLDLRIDQKWIVSCSRDGVVRVWERKTLEPYRILRGHEGPVNAVGLQNGRVVSASGDGKLILWDIESGERLRTFEGHNRGLACIEFKGDLIVSGSNDCKIKIWSASSGECLRDLTGHTALVRGLSFDPRSGRLVSTSYDKTIKLWDLATGRMVREFEGAGVHTSHIFDVKFDASRIVSASHDQKVVVHDFSAGLNTTLFI